jgi:hypothetical protein
VFIPLELLEAVVHLTHDFEIGEADVLTGALFSAAALAQVLASGLGDQFYGGRGGVRVPPPGAAPLPARDRADGALCRLIAVDVLVALGTAVG